MAYVYWYSTIHTVLKELQDEAVDPKSLLNVRGAPRKQELTVLIKNLEESLKGLDEIIRKYQGLTRRDRRIWNQLRLATENLETNRSKLTLHVTAINAFTSSLSRESLVQIETVLLELVSEVRQGRREPSLASLHETDDDSFWRELEDELAADGISGTDITKHKAAIKVFVQGLLSETNADTTSLVEIASLIELDNDDTDSKSSSHVISAIDISPEDAAESPIASDAQNGSLVSLDDEQYEIADEEIPPKETGASISRGPIRHDPIRYNDAWACVRDSRALRPVPPGISSAPEPFRDTDDFTPNESEHGESQSIVDGIERITITEHQGGDIAVGRSRTHRHPKALKAKNDAYVDFSNKTLVPEQTDFMIQQLERKADPRVRRTYENGVPLDEVVPSAPVLTVGLTFLPGADKSQINRSEQINMEGNEANQKDALWRVTTAGSLLTQFNVSPDLQISQTDQTASILRRAKFNTRDRDPRFPDQRKALARSSRTSATVTIDSARVTVVNDLQKGDWDLRGLLVEVDYGSLWDLMVDCRNLIAGGGSDMTLEETSSLLDTMIENARRLCIRSPILFRMSTRVRIIHSEDTRYGINHGPMFRTLITSKGIKEIISNCAACYNSLDSPPSSSNMTQKDIKPRFLQMVVLLLSLLNNEDLAELKDFLEATYKLKADRRDIELLILKVIPLLSINPRVFLNALVPATEGFRLESGSPNVDEDHSKIWNIFIRRILLDGYLLPGTVDDLGQARRSWIVKWPEDGFKSTSIFNNLQYAGRLRAINNIPPVEVHPESDCTELTVVMTDDSKYVINPRDLDNIMFMTPGIYPMQETAERKRRFDLVIQKTQLDSELHEATKMTNEIVHNMNQWLANPRRGGTVMSKIIRKPSDHQSFLNDVRGSGRLVRMVAVLDQGILAVTYKVDGCKVSRISAVQTMARDIRQLRAVLSHIEQRGDMTDHEYFSQEKGQLKQSVEQVKAQINLAEESRTRIGLDQEVSDEPIVKCLYPEGRKISNGGVWNEYRAVCQDHHGALRVDAIKSTITGVKWLTRKIIELSLSEPPSKVVVTPLKPVPEGYRDDEVRVGDMAMLVGQYVAIGEPIQECPVPHAACSMTNYLKIVSVEEQNQSRRGKNRGQDSNAMGTCYFR